MKYILIITGKMCSFNEYINAERHSRFDAASIKKEETERVAWEAKAQKLPTFFRKVNISYRIFVDTNRKDEDSHLYAIKLINDGLVMAGIIPNDSRKYLHIKNIEFPEKGQKNRIVTEIEEEA